MQVLDVTEAHQGARNLLPALHVRKQVRAACERHCLRPFTLENPRSLVESAWRAELEERQPHHELSTFSFSGRDFGGRGTSFTALPSPPSHGGGTCSASGQLTFGK